EIVFAWTKKEFSNLSKFEGAGVRVPHPIAFRDNVLIFELLLDGDAIAPQLKKVYAETAKPAEFLKKVVENMRKIHKAGFVHSDLSEYNLLVSDGEPVIIDCAQAVLLAHPRSKEFLERDCENVAHFFSKKMGVKVSPADILKRVVG
ncbi:MAG: RIO1 family regulatory kinase/ATPase, partial [archaeon]